MKNRNWFWGAFFMLSAVLVIASQVWSFEKIGIVSIIATVFLVALVIQSLFNRSFFGIFLPLSILYMMYSKPLMLMYISPWLLILSAILLSIGFGITFQSRPKTTEAYNPILSHFSGIKEDIGSSSPYFKVTMNSASKYLHTENLKGGHFISNLGMLEVYFDQAQLDIGGAELFIKSNLGSVVLYVPKHWNVENNIHNYMGDVSYSASPAGYSEDAPKLSLYGSTVMGEIRIVYIEGVSNDAAN